MARVAGGKKFDRLMVARVYFGNWLRDYCAYKLSAPPYLILYTNLADMSPLQHKQSTSEP
jgi:hypothetical protein